MAEAPRVVSKEEDASARKASGVGWGLLLIWIGLVLFLRWGWGLGLAGAGVIVLAAQAWRRRLGLEWERSGIVFGLLLLLCGLWTLLGLTVDLLPVLFILAGIALLVSAWTAHRPHAPGGPTDLHAPSHPRA